MTWVLAVIPAPWLIQLPDWVWTCEDRGAGCAPPSTLFLAAVWIASIFLLLVLTPDQDQ